MGKVQVLRDKIGTAIRQIKSRTDQFPSSYMVRKGRGRRKSDFSREGVQMYVGHRKCVPQGKV